jgi:hypothetical protein
LLERVVDQDAAAMQESRALAMRLKKDDHREALPLHHEHVGGSRRGARTSDYEQRRKPMPAGLKLVIVAVNTPTWAAHVPTDAPRR